MPRALTGDLNGPEQIQVVSQPVDAYVQPGPGSVPSMAKANKLKELATTLSSVQPSLQRYIQNEIREQSDEEFQEGQRARIQNALDFKEAVETGKIDKTQSPWFMKGYNLQSGKAAAYNYDQDVRIAYAESGMQNTRDPKAIEKFLGDFRTQWLTKNGRQDADFMDGLIPMMGQAEGNIRTSHTSGVAQAIKAENFENLTTDHMQTMERLLASGASLEEVAAQLDGTNGTQVFTGGFTRGEINEITVDNIVTLAEEKRDPRILKLADHIQAGKHALSDRPSAKRKLADARAQIASRTAAEYRLSNEIQEDIRNKKKVDVSTRALNKLIEDPSADMTPFFKEAAGIGSPELINALNSMQGAVEANSQQPDMGKVRSLIVGIRNGQKDEQDVLDAFVAGDINIEYEGQLRDMVTKTKEEGSPVRDPEFQTYSTNLQRTLVGDEFSIDRQADQIEAMNKVYQFQEDYMDFMAADPKTGQPRERPATQREKTEFLQERSRYYQWKGADDRTRHRLFLSGQLPPKDIQFTENLRGLGDDMFKLHPELYDPNKHAVFSSLQDLGNSITEYNQALQASPNAARNTYFGKLVIDTGMSPQELKAAQERILNKK